MKTYRHLVDAATQYDIEPEKLRELVEEKAIRAQYLQNEHGKQLIVLDRDVRAWVADRDVTCEQFKHLDGTPIMLSEAAKKYGFSTSSLWRWIGQEHIRVIKRVGKRVFLDEADIAYARALADMKKLRSGQALFGRITKK